MVTAYSAYRPTSIEHCDKDAENELCDHESCPPTDDPVCGQNSKKKRKYFSNLCHLDNYNCKNDNGKQCISSSFEKNSFKQKLLNIFRICTCPDC